MTGRNSSELVDTSKLMKNHKVLLYRSFHQILAFVRIHKMHIQKLSITQVFCSCIQLEIAKSWGSKYLQKSSPFGLSQIYGVPTHPITRYQEEELSTSPHPFLRKLYRALRSPLQKDISVVKQNFSFVNPCQWCLMIALFSKRHLSFLHDPSKLHHSLLPFKQIHLPEEISKDF